MKMIIIIIMRYWKETLFRKTQQEKCSLHINGQQPHTVRGVEVINQRVLSSGTVIKSTH